MRLKSEIWVQALLRSNQVAGRFGAVLHKGASEAGAVYVVINHLDGTCTLLGPRPGPSYDSEGQRLFRSETPHPVPWSDIAAKIERTRKFDPDIWVVEIEDRTGMAGITHSQE